MSDTAQNTESIQLWDCLHDGTLESLRSDLVARTVTFVIDVPFHWEFNNLPPDTRFQISLTEVLAASPLTFVPWPTRQTYITAADYELSVEESRKGRLQSVDWDEAFRKLEPARQFDVSGASFTETSPAFSTLCLQGSIDATGDYYELRIEAKHSQFFIGDNEVPLKDFVEFGERYWHAFATRTRPEDTQKEPE
jgi:hypothetical protein